MDAGSSAARAFLHPVAKRPNLTIATDSLAVRLLHEGDRITGVRVRQGGIEVDHQATREVILSLGSIGTPKLLQLSGIGPADVLRSAGVDVVVDSPNVGAHLREHRCFSLQFRLNREVGYNRLLSTKPRQALTGLRYLAKHDGPMAAPAYDVIAFVKTDPALDRPDAQLLMTPLSARPYSAGEELGVEREPGAQCIGFVLRPESEGSVAITSADPEAPLDIVANYYTAPYDREVGVGIFHTIRKLFSTDPLAGVVDHETLPGPEVPGDHEDATISTALDLGILRLPRHRDQRHGSPRERRGGPGAAGARGPGVASRRLLSAADHDLGQSQRAHDGNGVARLQRDSC